MSPYASDYTEVDPSPDATLAAKWLESPSTYFERTCSLNPGSPECRTFEE